MQLCSGPFGSQKSSDGFCLASGATSPLHPQLWHSTVTCLQNLADTRSASSKETRQENKLLFFFLWVPSRVTQSARFICGRRCSADRCCLSSYFSHLDIHWLQWNWSWSLKRYKGKISTGCCVVWLTRIVSLDLELCAFPGGWGSSPELDVCTVDS